MITNIIKVSAGRFERDKLGWWLVGLNLFAAANSTLYFTTQLKAGLDGWMAMNSCAPSIFIFAIGYIIRNRTVMAVGSGIMFRYGVLGLFVFGWTGMNIIPQIGHILMTLALIYFIVRTVRLKGWNDLVVGAFVAIVLIYAEWQWKWFGAHPRILETLMHGKLTPDMFK